MKFLTRIIALGGLIAAFALPAAAQPALYVEGTHYTKLPKNVRTVDPDKIEVTEVFWYGCGHCYAFEPLIHNYEENLPEDVVFVRSPGMWNGQMQVHAQVFYTAKELGVLEQVHEEIFDQIHLHQNYLLEKDDVQELFADVADVSKSDFDEVWDSFSVSSSVNRANSLMSDYGIRGVPNMIVNGKYRVESSDAVPTHDDILKVVDFLVEKERSEG